MSIGGEITPVIARFEGYVRSLSPETWLDRLLLPSLTDVMVTILALVVVVATCLIVVLLKYH